MRGDAPVESPLEERERLIRREWIERRTGIETEISLRSDPSPEAADRVDADVKIRKVVFGDDFVLGVMKRDRGCDRFERRADIRYDGTQPKADPGTAEPPAQFAVRQCRDDQAVVRDAS